ncbi:MAG: hypothetical protein ACRDKH_08205 [Solirubrobacterales bacterium]
MLATIVDTNDLWQTVAASFAAGVGITFTFSLMILGAARLADRNREERSVTTAVAGLVVASGLVLTVAGIALGIVVMVSG